MRQFFIKVLVLLVVATPALAQRSAKRGICWDERTQPLTDAPIQKMAPGVGWLYNWGPSVTGTPTLVGQGADKMAFLPMCWNGGFDETLLRQYLTAHAGEVTHLLTFNEPNLTWNVGGSQMTPQQAADAWPQVKQVAQDFGLKIVAPALNFTGDKVGDRVWEPFAWYDEFFRLVPDAGIDYLCFHSYMNWYSAVNWVATEYFYTDREPDDLFHANNKTKYPYLVKYLEDYKAAHGQFPRMFLTEFCAWEGNKDGYTSTLDAQIDQMTQKVQKLEQSELVAGYAWFMANTSQSPTAYPYNSVFQSNTPDSELSTLGQVYVHMSTFDTGRYYAVGEEILAKDYVDASMDSQQARVRPNSEPGSSVPLQVEWQQSAWTAYQVTLPADGTYTLTLHMKSEADAPFRIYENALGAANKRLDATLSSTNGQWADVATDVTLPRGQHTLLLYNMGASSIFVNSLRFSEATGIRETGSSTVGDIPSERDACYTLDGRKIVNRPSANSQLPRGVYICGGRKVVVR